MAEISQKAKRERFIVELAQKNRLVFRALDKYRCVRKSMTDKARERKSARAKRDLFWTDKRDYGSDLRYFEHKKVLLDAMPESNGCRWYQPYDARMGVICDEFLYNSLMSSASLVPVTPDNYSEVCKEIDLLLVVSAWRGVSGEWTGLGNTTDPLRQKVYAAIDTAKAAGVPVVFYSKEDPPNYEVFLDIAKRCDRVFTSCAEVVEKYRADCGHDRIEVLCFSINPEYHNPIGLRRYPKENAVIFSGTWMTKYPERLVDMKTMFDGVLSAGWKLKILDRCYSRNNTRYMFPEEYWQCVSPEVSHDYLQKIHKTYDWAININTIKDSDTMFANRAYELQAVGNLMLSNYSKGVDRLFPGIFIVRNEQDAIDALTSLSPEQVYERQMAGVRRVMTGETGFDRMGQILAAAGLKTEQPRRRVIIFAEDVEAVREMAEKQSFSDGTLELLPISELTDETLSRCDAAAFWGGGYTYGEHYIEDMVNGFKYTACDYITKAAYYEGGTLRSGTEHDYTDLMPDKYRTVFWARTFTARQLAGLDGMTTLPNGYSIDRFEISK